MKMQRLVLSVLLNLVLAAPALADTPFQFAVPGAQAPPDPNVDGFRIALFHGKNEGVFGFDLGLVSLSQAAEFSGFSMIFGVGHVTGHSSGFAGAMINFHTGEDTGVNGAFVNIVKRMQSGANVGFVNFTDGFSAVDISGVGISQESQVQVGFVNITKKIKGLQIGFLNVAENGLFPVFPFFNIPKQ